MVKKERPIWIVKIGEPVPHDLDHKNDRLFRAGLLSKYLADTGNNVIWWTSTFDHARKKKKFDSFNEVEISPRLKVAFLKGCNYYRNVSIRRIVNHIQIARQFKRFIYKYDKPGIIVLSFPTPELCDVGVKFGNEFGIPTIVDIRDLWPDDIVNLCPSSLYYPAKLMTIPMKRMARRIFRNATNLTGVTSGYLEYGLKLGSRVDDDNHRVFHLAYTNPNSDKIINQIIDNDNIADSDSTIRLVFAGMLGVSVDMNPIFNAVLQLRSLDKNVVFDICGRGDKYDDYKNKYGNEEFFNFHGFVNHEYLDDLFKRSHFGILPYLNLGSLSSNIPNKVGEYLSYGLPILSTLSGASAKLIESEGVGTYFNSQKSAVANCLAESILSQIDDSNEWRHRRRRCRCVYSARFDAERVYRDYGNWIRKLAVF